MITFKISDSFKRSGHSNIVWGYKFAEIIFNSPQFSDEILKIKNFTYTDDSPFEVYTKIKSLVTGPSFEIIVEPYYYRNSSVIGMTKGDGKIFVNTNGAEGRVSGEYMENALHELAHFPLGYGHGNNFPNGFRAKLLGDIADKNKSIPYVFSRIGKEIYKEFL